MSGAWARVLAVALLLCAVLGSAGVASAQEDTTGEAFRGQVRDGGREPVEGAEIVVTDPDGNEVGAAVTDENGEWQVPVPGPGSYAVTIQEDSLPEGVGLRNPERASAELDLRTSQTRTVGFAMGEARGETASSLSQIPQRALQGLRFGLIIAMTAIGLSLVFGTTGLINFAHGELVTFGAVVAYFLNIAGPGIPLIGAAAIAVVAGGLLGASLERGLWQPLRKRRTGLVQMLVISIGLTLVLRHLILMAFGGGSRRYSDYAIQSPLTFGPFRITPRDLFVIILSIIALAAVAFLLQRTRLGKAMRAVADNRDLAESSGIDVKKIIIIVWVLGGSLAALGGVFLGVAENINYLMGFQLLLLMFAGVILGGLGTVYGAVVGSLVVGMVTEISTVWLTSELKTMWALIVLILVLLVRPQGILGIKERIG